MSGIYIPGMEMPTEHEIIYIFGDGTVRKGINSMRENLQTSKAIPVTDHGRLSDADFIMERMDEQTFNMIPPTEAQMRYAIDIHAALGDDANLWAMNKMEMSRYISTALKSEESRKKIYKYIGEMYGVKR